MLTTERRGLRLPGEFIPQTNAFPDGLKNVFSPELNGDPKQQEKSETRPLGNDAAESTVANG